MQSPTREQLIGTWRLVRIEVAGPKGPIDDPFYQADSAGLLVYAASGWVSVQIGAPHRETWPTTTARLTQHSGLDARLKTAAFDSYYAYFGTWRFDATNSVVTHRVTESLIPAEAGASYSQTVTLDGSHMTLTSTEEINGIKAVRKKLWQRADDVAADPRLVIRKRAPRVKMSASR